MKTALSFVLIVFVTLACDQSRQAISPSDQLYKRWKSVEIGQSGKWRDITPEIIEFRADGTILYEDTRSICCSPIKVERKRSVMKVLETGSRIGDYCAQVSCVAISELYILLLNDTELVIDYRFDNDSIFAIRYKAVP